MATNTISGSDADESLFGTAGRDFLSGFEGDDILYGGMGDDTLVGGSGADWLRAGDDDDILQGASGADTLRAGTGDDVVSGGAGRDTFEYTSGADTIADFTAGESIVIDARLLPGSWDDLQRLFATSETGGTLIDFGRGDSLLIEGVLPSALDPTAFGFPPTPDESPEPTEPSPGPGDGGGTGDDGAGDGGAGDGGGSDGGTDGGGDGGAETPTQPPVDPAGDSVFGTQAADDLSGGPGPDVMLGGFGDDTIKGAGGSDRLLGFGDDDILIGNSGADTLVGAAGDDTLTGGAGPDVFEFGAGNDVITDLGAGDVVDLTANFRTEAFWKLVARMEVDGADTVLRFDADTSLRFAQTAPGEIGGEVFGFAADAARVSADAPPPDTSPADGGGGFIFDLQEGTAGDDRLAGTAQTDLASGGAGDDTILGSAGADTVDGGAGRDTVAYDGPASAFTLAIGRGDLAISGGSAGTDLLRDAELPEFGDGTVVDLDTLTGVASLSPEDLRALTEMYIAYFDRAPDAEGLFYWGTRLADGMTMEEIARSFFTQDESVAAFPDPGDSAALVDAAYRNLLERDPDAEGRAYWIEALNDGDVSQAEFMLALISGARDNDAAGDDVRTITAKADLGLYYAAINGLSNVAVAEAVMGLFDADNAGPSLAAARALIDGFAAEARDGDGIGDEFTMPLVGVIEDPFLA